MNSYTLPAVLSIAGSDSSGGAGIQADIKTIEALGLFAETAITALTAQNTQGVRGVFPVDPEFVRSQIDAVFEDIPPQAVKIGMVDSPAVIDAIADRLRFWQAPSVVVDPVMVATSGSTLIQTEAVATLQSQLFPLATVITPNLSEAEVLCGHSLDSEEAIVEAAEEIAQHLDGVNVPAILIKGGHGVGDPDTANDYLRLDSGEGTWFRGPRVPTANSHGTGCTLSSAIASYLALGSSIEEAVAQAKDYVTGALAAGLNLGHGSGPLDHGWTLR